MDGRRDERVCQQQCTVRWRICRNSDDCTTVYATRMGFKGGCKNITMQNSTLWADVAHPIFIGLHGDAEGQEVMENLNYINIDILDHKESR